MKVANHEIWRKCPNCGAYNDLRMTNVCEECKTPLARRRFWTAEEDELLKKMFPDHYTEEICRLLRRSYSSVSGRAYLFSLKKSESFKQMELEKQTERLIQSSQNSRFAKGNVPHNKGEKMSAETKEKIIHTFFPKGHLPHNTKYDGHERVSKDGYIEVRIRKGKYVLKHRLLWEQVHGEIPKGYVVKFINNNPLDIRIENLELISNAELMRQNTIHRYTPELKSAIKTLSKLKKTIQHYEK